MVIKHVSLAESLQKLETEETGNYLGGTYIAVIVIRNTLITRFHTTHKNVTTINDTSRRKL